MRNLKNLLLAATMVAGFAATQVQAQVVIPAPDTSDAALHGAGASSVQNLVVRNFNCIGADHKLAKSSAATALSTISAGLYVGTTMTQDCSAEANNLQPNISAEYVSTGSGFGRQMWKEFADDFDGGTSATAAAGVFNPFVNAANPTHWSNLQFVFSDAGLSQAELNTYNSVAAPKAGPAITFPMFVLPIAIAYDTTYGTNAKGHAMVFNTQGKGLSGTTTINLSKAAYCGIFNGTILNWNDAAITKLNKKIPLYDVLNDTAARWTADGAPIRLVGRLDKSGTTDVFTRHLAAVCNATNGYTGVNNYLQHAETLPYGTGTGVDFRSVRSDVNYFPTVASSKLAGTTNMVSGDYWNGTAIVNIGSGSATYPSTSGSTSTPTGNLGSGLYIVADGGGKVASALVSAPDYSLHGVMLNGKVGYISADFIQPSVDAPGGLQAAGLQVGTSATFALPTVMAALKGFTQLPPEAAATTGAYTPGADTRLVLTATGGTTKVAATRDNPLAWTDVLYADSTNTLADPQAAGAYPISGTTQFFGYTCYTKANRLAIGNALGLQLGKINKNSANVTISKTIFGGTPAANPGIDVQSNIGIVPAAWTAAIANTFLSKGDAGALGLYIQDALVAVTAKGSPFKADGKTPNPSYKPQVDPQANPACASITGNGA